MYGHGVIYEGTYLNININSDIKRDEITAAYEKEQREKEQREKEQRRRNSKKSRNEGYSFYIDGEEFYRDEDGTIFTAAAWYNLLG